MCSRGLIAALIVGFMLFVPVCVVFAQTQPALLRNDEVTTLYPPSPAAAAIFTGGTSGCSADTSVTLDAYNPANCTQRTEGEGSLLSGNGSEFPDDFYIANFLTVSGPQPDTENDVLDDTMRPIIYYQMEFGCCANCLKLAKDLTNNTVKLDHGTCTSPDQGACCDASLNCTLETEADCLALPGTFVGVGVGCTPDPCHRGACCDPMLGCVDDVSPAECDAAGGLYKGDGLPCSDDPPTCDGACCQSDTSCDDFVAEADSTAARVT
jgi:hypothetical protein